MEFPLRTPFDVKYGPPEVYLWMQMVLFLVCGALWTIAYVLYIRKSFRDKSYGMPLLPLCLNVSWEFLYIINPPTILDRVAFTIPFILDLFIVYATIKFWPREWGNSPLIAKNLITIITLSIAMSLVGMWAFKIQFQDITDVAFWSGFLVQVSNSLMSIMQLLSRGSTRGHSWGIWWSRAVGTFAIVCMLEMRVWHYPRDWPDGYGFIHSPCGALVMWSATLMDFLVYPVVFKYVEKFEGRQKHIKNI